MRRNMSVDEIQADSLNGRLWAAAVHGRVDELRALVETGANCNVEVAWRDSLRCIFLPPMGM
eukprot:5884254-Pyramimonas_sp.AAC.2